MDLKLAIICSSTFTCVWLIIISLLTNSWRVGEPKNNRPIFYGLRQFCTPENCEDYMDQAIYSKLSIAYSFLVTSLLPSSAIAIHVVIVTAITKSLSLVKRKFYVAFQAVSAVLQLTALIIFSKKASDMGDNYGYSFYLVILSVIIGVFSIGFVTFLSTRNAISPLETF